MSDNFPRYDRLPEKMQSAARNYVENGNLHGDFLRAVVENDLVNAYGKADFQNRACLEEWTLWLYNDVPRNCWGDIETVDEWIEHDGLEGLE